MQLDNQELQEQIRNIQVQQAQQLLEAQNDADAVIGDLRERLVTLELEKDHAQTYGKVKEEEFAKRQN